MSQISAAPLPPPKPGVPRAPVKRLATLKKPIIPTPIRRPQAKAQSTEPNPPPKPTTHPKTVTCPNQGCSSPEIVEDDGKKVCVGCGTVISEANIVSEVTFGESSSGAAVVQGTFVGADQSHGRSFGPGFQRGGGMESREITEQNGNRYINQLSRALNVPESATKAAGQVFKLAVGLNFIQGRRTKTVAAVCLYIACRRQENNTVMLIDFADVLMINVFKLGRAYKALLDELRLGGNVFLMNPVEPESLIYRFAKQLEFGAFMMQVAGEAVRIVQRMNRDWMITGRRPAGICGAALILAARMNNFRRTVREVVFVVKVTEVTIMQRLNEFKDTESGDLTVDQFRSVQLENSRDPPAFIQAREGKKSRRSKKRKSGETAEDNEGDDSDESSRFSETPQPPAKRAKRVDADGFAIPDIPIDPALKDQNGSSNSKESTPDSSIPEDASAKSKGGRPKGPAVKPPPPTAAELAIENALEDEMTELLSSSTLVASSTQPPKKPVSSSTEVDSAEFESDPEVSNCLLTPAEVEIKERIWVHENKDYLRTQQAKMLKRSLTEDPEGAGTRSKPRKKRKGRMGDVGYLEGENGSRASTPAEATMLMLEKRGFSKKINYKMLEDLYGEEIPKGGSPSKKSKSSSQDPNATAATGRRRTQSVARSREGSPRRSMSKSVEPDVAARRQQRSRTQRAATPAAAPPAPEPEPQAPAQPTKQPKAPEPPADPNEEVLGYLPGYEDEDDEEAELETGPPPALPEDDEDDDDDDDDEEDDGVEAAFAGNYYDDDSDGGGYDDDDYY